MKKWITLFRLALDGSEQSYTSGSINRAIFLLSVPMILEMIMESLFAVVDVFFVSKVSIDAVATVGLTESVITLIYSIAIGLSTAATALVARRVGEGNADQAGRAIGQIILISLVISVVMAGFGFVYAGDILQLMGADSQVIESGTMYARITFLSSPAIVLLYSLSGALRGAGAASAAMRSLWVANGLNMILDPLFIFGIAFFPEMGVTGAAVATTIGRVIGVGYQLYFLYNSRNGVSIEWADFVPDFQLIKSILSLAAGGTSQFLISSASWIFLARMLAEFGTDVVAGYTIAIRVIIFTLLPAWGMANAAATLVGQNLGAGHPDRAETSVWRTAYYNMWFLLSLAVLFFLAAEPIISLFNTSAAVVQTGVTALRVLCLGYGFYAYGMVIIQAINGAGDTRTPIYLNIICFWLIEIPVAYILALLLNWGPIGVFAAVPIGESILAIMGILVFRRGRWKLTQV
ncbi:MATE family efflux transporter [Arundinibacter roseus]|uniref:Multidrug-efflux transporter n=1 Tax=Arundinibacter roseus TaxID=2070510 RepID=A0A4R4K8X3_9BACT|nr:MATE family efflux transporter [Arundinibacter roseus]TDB64204.1 MATE family efflux transporter [Arundinibacter roseus]